MRRERIWFERGADLYATNTAPGQWPPAGPAHGTLAMGPHGSL